jgi:hypothetical protein
MFESPDKGALLAGIGAAWGLVAGLVVGALRLANTPAPQLGLEWPGNIVFLLVYVTPFGLALLALRRRWATARPAVWLAAAGLAGLAVYTSFSGVTLLILAVLMALGGRAAGSWLADITLGALLAVLGAAAWLLLWSGPEQGYCWRQVLQSDGSSVWQIQPFGETITGRLEGTGGVFRSICASDIITLAEAGLALLPLVAAGLLAWRLGAPRSGRPSGAGPV